MSWSKKHPRLLVLCAAIVATGTIVGVGSLRAEGTPEMNTLVYTGRLVEDGVPADGMRDIRVTLWSDPTSTDATAHRLCRVVPAADLMVQDGYFRIALDADDDSCERAVMDQSEVWVEVEVEGTTLSPRTQIAAVPYALEANRASSAAGALRQELDELVPAGTITPFAGEASSAIAPPGWLFCDGRALASTDPRYSRLFLAIRTAWGNGGDDADPSTDFNVPDLRGRFLRGLDQGTGRDLDAAARTQSALGGNAGDLVGTLQADALQGHSHRHNLELITLGGSGGPIQWGGSAQRYFGAAIFEPVSDGVHGTPRLSSETRPANATVNYLIRL